MAVPLRGSMGSSGCMHPYVRPAGIKASLPAMTTATTPHVAGDLAQATTSTEEMRSAYRDELENSRHHKKPWLGVVLVALLCVLYGAVFTAMLIAQSGWLKCALAVLLGLTTGGLFIVGHDASHGSLLRSAAANRWLARLCFLPSAHPNETWDSEHNRQHHRWTNLATKDSGYPPLTLAQYQALSPLAKAWHRLGYRLPFIAVRYLRIWWRSQIRIYQPRRDMVRSINTFRFEVSSIARFFIMQTFAVWQFGAWAGQGTAWIAAEWLVCIALPFYVWNTTMAFVTIQHHTHPSVRWYDNEADWSVFADRAEGPVHVTWLLWREVAFHSIFQHTAHHLDTQVPLYNLRSAQGALSDAFPQTVTVQKGSLRNLSAVLKTCQLYDYRSHRWMDWDGAYTN